MSDSGNVRLVGERVFAHTNGRGLYTATSYIVKGLPDQPRRYEARLGTDGRTVRLAVAGAFEADSVSAVGPAASLTLWGETELASEHAPEIIERLAAVMVALEAGKVVPLHEEVTTNTYGKDDKFWVDEQVAVVGLEGWDDIMTLLQCSLGSEDFGDTLGARMTITGNGALLPLGGKGYSEAVMRTFEVAEAVSELILQPPNQSG